MGAAVGPTEILAGIVQVFFLGTAFGLGGLLLQRARRSGDRYTRWLGLHLILAMGFGYLLLSFATVAVELHLAAPRALIVACIAFGNLATFAGLAMTLEFTRAVFRAEEPRAKLLCRALLAGMLGGWALHGASGGFASARYDGLGGSVMLASIVLANGWISYEPLRYHRTLLRRLDLGLAEARVVDRVRLWGMGSLARTLLTLIGVGSAVAVRWLDPASALLVAKVVLVLVSLCGAYACIAYWLAFSPTPAYLERVERRAEARRAAQERARVTSQ